MSTGLNWFKSSYSGGGGGDCVEVAWFKSSYSGGGGGECVEVAWVKSSYSGGGGGNCVEVAKQSQSQSQPQPQAVLVRDSKDTARPHLTVSPTAWERFIAFTA